MDIFDLKADLKVFGVQVKTFPEGIGEAFDALIKMLPGGFDRSFYGISLVAGSQLIYRAAAIETYDGEAEKYNCERYIIEKGAYLSVTIDGWRKKTGCIKDVFHEMMKDSLAGTTSPCVEWYKNNDEMCCLVKRKYSPAGKII